MGSIRVYRVKYEFAFEVEGEDADKLVELLADRCGCLDEGSHFVLSDDFRDDFSEDEIRENERLFKLLEPLRGGAIAIFW
jgi:hypothetical protein